MLGEMWIEWHIPYCAAIMSRECSAIDIAFGFTIGTMMSRESTAPTLILWFIWIIAWVRSGVGSII